MLIENRRGNYRFLRGSAPYSSGAVALPGYEVVHVRLRQPTPWRAGFRRVDAYLRSVDRGRHALAGMELRCPEPYSIGGFVAFNHEYCAMLKSWDLYVDGINPVARTNVSPAFATPTEPVLYGFSYTAPADHEALTFVAAGAGELQKQELIPEGIVRRGETSSDAMREKAACVMDAMAGRLAGMGGTWADVTAVDVYTVHPNIEVLEEAVFQQMGYAAIHGVQWFHARPPIVEIEFEMDLRGVRRELVL